MTAVRIEVTEQDIADGIAGQCDRCPIAIAIARACAADTSVRVGPALAGISAARMFGTAFVKLPESAQDFIFRFDAARPVEPFSFTLDIPAGLLEGATS